MNAYDSARLARAALLIAAKELANQPLVHCPEFDSLRREIVVGRSALDAICQGKPPAGVRTLPLEDVMYG